MVIEECETFYSKAAVQRPKINPFWGIGQFDAVFYGTIIRARAEAKIPADDPHACVCVRRSISRWQVIHPWGRWRAHTGHIIYQRCGHPTALIRVGPTLGRSRTN